ncbi:CDP-alcohol phosphatidyltransferase family protein [Streptomonospora sp. DSM 45055]|uniref:CDP-alcohol phosphatidyltransferase family protein n=2 Tax=Streptomonospora wellingtoniae TaxID=3075544 RepID=A0ABU2KTW1_9ACTN|nr:CDP-alcohol phosphatidyltransferase family protein [Streptomonospora sp. DSM 45055]MDT0302740.1 CDP-alcohol phosphatidyltransferase family protein [Streptomonospora sp. DSM 45055]
MASRVSPRAQARSAGDRVWTVPNLLSMLRLVGVPVFLWLVLVPQADWWALGVLAFAGISDWLDGKIARAWNQMSRLGTLLDPMADRLYIFAALLGLVMRGIVPWWLMAVLVLRDVLMVLALPVLRYYGYGTLPVNFAGKAATLCLLYSFPLLFVAEYAGIVGDVARVAGWAFAIWGTAIYWWAGLLYAVQGRRLIAHARRADHPSGTGENALPGVAATSGHVSRGAPDPAQSDQTAPGRGSQSPGPPPSGTNNRKGATSPP